MIDCLPQSLAVATQSGVGEVLAPHLESVEEEFVGDVAGVFVRFLGLRLQLEFPAIGAGVSAAELVVMRVIDRVIAVASLNDHGEAGNAISDGNGIRVMICAVERHFDVIDAALKVPVQDW